MCGRTSTPTWRSPRGSRAWRCGEETAGRASATGAAHRAPRQQLIRGLSAAQAACQACRRPISGRGAWERTGFGRLVASLCSLGGRCLQGVKVAFIAAGSAACHSIIGDVNGLCYTWGRNEVRLRGRGRGGCALAAFSAHLPQAGRRAARKLPRSHVPGLRPCGPAARRRASWARATSSSATCPPWWRGCGARRWWVELRGGTTPSSTPPPVGGRAGGRAGRPTEHSGLVLLLPVLAGPALSLLSMLLPTIATTGLLQCTAMYAGCMPGRMH